MNTLINKGKKSVRIDFEDTNGCCSIFNSLVKYREIIGDYFIISASGDNKSSTNIFHINKNDIIKDDVDYYIIVFDLDPPETLPLFKNDYLLKYEAILHMFNKYSENNGINVIDPSKNDYIGDKIILIPSFFCAETLYLFLNELNEIFTAIPYEDYQPFDILHCNMQTAECPIAYYKVRRENPKNRYFGKVIQKYYRVLTEELLKRYFTNEGIKLEEDRRLNKAINHKRTHEVMNKLCEVSGVNLYKQLRTNMGYYAVFNKALFDLFSIKTDSDIDKLIKRYNFHTYQHTMENLLSIYEGMICWDPSKDKNFSNQTWYKQYITYLNQEFTLEQTQYFISVLNNLCRYYIK